MKNIELLEGIYSQTDYVVLNEFGGRNKYTKAELLDIIRHFENEDLTIPSGISLLLPPKYSCSSELKKNIKNLPEEINRLHPFAVMEFGLHYYFIYTRPPEKQSAAPEKIQLKAIVDSKILYPNAPSSHVAQPIKLADFQLTPADYDFASNLPPQTQSETTKSIIRYFKSTHQIVLDYNYQASKIFSTLLRNGFIIHEHLVYFGKETMF